MVCRHSRNWMHVHERVITLHFPDTLSEHLMIDSVRIPLLILLSAIASASEVAVRFEASSDVLGRDGFTADNGLVAVGVSPMGARILRFDLAGRPLLWTDRAGVAEMRPPSGDGDEMWWFKGRGGAFFWPTSQAHWRRSDAPYRDWPPPPAFERGLMVAVQDAGGIDLHGPAERNPLWRSLGMQPSYRMVVPRHQSRLIVHATWTNLAPHPQRIGQWFLATAPARGSAGPAEVVWPLRSAKPSRFGARGYVQQSGNEDPEMWRPDPAAGLLRATCLGRPGKISSDSDGGWIAWRDPGDGSSLAIRFTPTTSEGTLPEGWSSVACFMAGAEAVEIEAMGSELDLDPGQRLIQTWELAGCRTAGPISAVTAGGMVSEPLRVVDGRIQGSFGVFVSGRASVRRDGAEIASLVCTPASALRVDLPAPAGSGAISIQLVSEDGSECELAAVR